jgi:hypothetical protein
MQNFRKLGGKLFPWYSFRLSVVPTRVNAAFGWTLSCSLDNFGENGNSIEDMSRRNYRTAVTNIRNVAQFFRIANDDIVADANRLRFYGRSTICDANTYDIGFYGTVLAGVKNACKESVSTPCQLFGLTYTVSESPLNIFSLINLMSSSFSSLQTLLSGLKFPDVPMSMKFPEPIKEC